MGRKKKLTDPGWLEIDVPRFSRTAVGSVVKSAIRSNHPSEIVHEEHIVVKITMKFLLFRNILITTEIIYIFLNITYILHLI